MDLSTSLLAVAAATAAMPLLLVGFRPLETFADIEKTIVAVTITALVGTIVVNAIHDLDIFGMVHLLYLLAVVTIPALTLAWLGLAYLRGHRRRLDVLLGCIGGIVAVCGLYATHLEPNWLRVDRAVVATEIGGALRIGVVADFQTPNVGPAEHRAIDQVLGQAPHIVVLPGDFYQGDPEALAAARADLVDVLRRLVERVPVVAVTSGDSDHGMELRPVVEEAGAMFIDDSVEWVEVNGLPVRLAGVRVVGDGPARSSTLAELSTPVEAVTILVAHRPDVVYELAEGADVDLIVAGHTHGGQIAIPFFGPLVTFSDVPRSAAAGGLSLIENIPVYVGTGVGLERGQAPQVRFGVRPSIGIIDVIPR